MYGINISNELKANIWINEKPIVNACYCSTLLVKEKTEMFANSQKLIVELFITRAHNNYALLGIDFSANEEGCVSIEFSINNPDNERYNSSIALPFDKVFLGIMDEFKEGIILSINEHLRLQTLPSGIINYNISAYGEVGSSVDMFKKVSDILLSLLVCDDINELRILEIIKENI